MKCNGCGLDNREGVLVCERCGIPLVSGIAPVTRQIAPPNTIGYIAPGTVRFPKRTRVMLHIKGVDKPIVADIDEQLTLGRFDVSKTGRPDVDFGPYGALEKGVSRTHATIIRGDDTLSIMDSGSTNGTWVGDKKLARGAPEVLVDGTHIWLAGLELVVFFAA